jgi:nitrogen regulatory protein PII
LPRAAGVIKLRINCAARLLIGKRRRVRHPVFAAAETQDRENVMKLIVAVIKPFKLEEVLAALTEIGVKGLMVSEINGYGRQLGHTEVYRGAEYVVNYVAKIRMEVVVADADAFRVIETITANAYTGRIGDGKIFIFDIESALRIRTGEVGENAL